MAKYLVTGAVGFIGTQISKILLESGHTVIGIDSLNDAYDPTIKQIRNKELSTFQDFKLLNMDICNNSLITEIPDVQFDAVIHSHVLEHVNEDILALKEISRILDLGGIAIITIPGNWRRKNTNNYRRNCN